MLKCPECGKPMKLKDTENGERIFVCDDHGAYVPKSIFGITGK